MKCWDYGLEVFFFAKYNIDPKDFRTGKVNKNRFFFN